MAIRLLHHTLPFLLLLSTAQSQAPSSSIPTDLTTGFLPSEQVQVSFSATASDGFLPGTVFSRAAVAQEPTFALGDSNGISPSTLYTLIMLDTTCPSARKLHYARSNFRFAFAGGTNIETDSPPLLEYLAPGALGERGDERQYVFLMYENPQRSEIASLQLPAEGEVFDVETFQGENGLDDAVAGVGMVVQLGGAVDCDGGGGADQGSSVGVSSAAATATSTTGGSATSVASASSIASATSVLVPIQTPSPQASSARPSSAPITSGRPPASTDSALTPRPTSRLTDEETDPSSAASSTTLSTGRATDAAPPTPTGSAIEQQTASAAAGVVVGQGVLLTCLLGALGVFGS